MLEKAKSTEVQKGTNFLKSCTVGITEHIHYRAHTQAYIFEACFLTTCNKKIKKIKKKTYTQGKI